MNSEKKVLALTQDTKERQIIVTHLTIRQSIFFLLLKLLLLEFIAAGGIIVVHSIFTQLNTDISIFNMPVFLLLVILKTFLMLFVIIQWLEEYYEITPKDVIHRKGLIFKKEERHLLNHLSSLRLEQSFLGRIFNYGTLKLHNWMSEEDFLLYLIHNPVKYHNTLASLLPKVDASKETLRENLIDKEKEPVSNEVD